MVLAKVKEQGMKKKRTRWVNVKEQDGTMLTKVKFISIPTSAA